MIFYSIVLSLLIPIVVLLGFFMISKSEKFEEHVSESFECGFSSYFYSRFSFSIQYFLVALIFLFLDLELCVIFPVFMGPHHSGVTAAVTTIMVSILLGGLLIEWVNGKLDWIS